MRDAAAKNLPNSLHIVVKSGGHGFGGLDGVDCINDLMAEFIEQASVKKLDNRVCSKN